MENEVWSEISAFLNNLRCGDVSRKSYLHFPELEEAEKIRKVKKANFETEMRKLNAEQRQQIENYLEAVQHLAFMEEERAYCQGYVDCMSVRTSIRLNQGMRDSHSVHQRRKMRLCRRLGILESYRLWISSIVC